MTSSDLRTQINAMQAADRRYNNLVNEGGEGFERNSVPESMQVAYTAALQAEFAAEWTLDVLNARRAEWNAACTSGKYDNLPQIERATGLKLADIARAKTLHNVK